MLSDIQEQVLSYMAKAHTLISGLTGSPAWLSNDNTKLTRKVSDVTLRSLLKQKLVHVDHNTLTTIVYKLTPKGKKKVKSI